MQKANVTVEMRHGASNIEPYRTSTLVVSDAVNHHTIVEVRLTPDQVYRMLTSFTSGEAISANVIDVVDLAHLNQKTHTFARLFQRDWDVESFDTDGRRDPALIPQLKEWAEAVKAATRSHEWDWRRQNNGIKFILWRYDNELTDGHVQEIGKVLADTPAPKGLK